MVRYKAYPEYRESGAGWLGKVPSHWEVLKLKRIASLKSGESITSEQINDSDDYPVYGGNGLRGYTSAYTHDGLYPVIGRQGALCGNVNYACGKFWASEHAVVASPVREVECKWLGELLRAMNLNQYSLSAAQPGLAVETISNLYIPHPQRPEQARITAFLDYETAKIDRLIAKQEELIALLKEKRQAVISNAIFKAPAGKTAKLAYYISLLPGYAFSSEAYTHDENDIRLLRGINISPSGIRWEDVVYWPSSKLDEYAEYQLAEGDIVFGMDRPWISEGARVCIVSQQDTPSLLLQRVARIRPFHRIRQMYLFFILGSNEFRSYIEADLTGVSVPHISADQIASFRCAIPSLEEQDRACAWIKHQLDRIETIFFKANEAIQLLQKRRTALISAAVTGKIDVRDWTPEQ